VRGWAAQPTRTPIPSRALLDHVDHVQHRVLQDALAEGTRTYWLRRAESFLAARPRPDDFHGQATTEDLRAQWHRLTEIADACRARAEVSLLDDLAPEVQEVLREVA
jgi:hypothetical protein